MSQVPTPALYNKYHVERDYELASLFEQVTKKYKVASVLYPGCYVHITPSFYIPRGVYVDAELPAKKFFADPDVSVYIESRKQYTETPNITFYHQSYEDPIDEAEGSFDLLVSQYAGFVSRATKQYLKTGGILLVNNSHGDAGLAHLDDDFELIGVANNRGGTHTLSHNNLDQYFVPKKKIQLTVLYLMKLGRGIGYTKTAPNYLFRKK